MAVRLKSINMSSFSRASSFRADRLAFNEPIRKGKRTFGYQKNIPSADFATQAPYIPQTTFSEPQIAIQNMPQRVSEDEIFKREIKRLREQIAQKNQQIQNSRNTPSPFLTKEVYDRYLISHKNQENQYGLRDQISYKELQKQKQQRERESALGMRLESLKRQQEEERAIRQEKTRRANWYRANLDAQNGLKSRIKLEERRQTPLMQNIPFQHKVRSFVSYDKSKQAVSYNPITGDLRDFSGFCDYGDKLQDQFIGLSQIA